MAKRANIIPKAPAVRILMEAGAKRVSAPAADAFVEVLTDITLEIAERAAKIARHAGRKTIHGSDIKMAVK